MNSIHQVFLVERALRNLRGCLTSKHFRAATSLLLIATFTVILLLPRWQYRIYSPLEPVTRLLRNDNYIDRPEVIRKYSALQLGGVLVPLSLQIGHILFQPRDWAELTACLRANWTSDEQRVTILLEARPFRTVINKTVNVFMNQEHLIFLSDLSPKSQVEQVLMVVFLVTNLLSMLAYLLQIYTLDTLAQIFSNLIHILTGSFLGACLLNNFSYSKESLQASLLASEYSQVALVVFSLIIPIKLLEAYFLLTGSRNLLYSHLSALFRLFPILFIFLVFRVGFSILLVASLPGFIYINNILYFLLDLSSFLFTGLLIQQLTIAFQIQNFVFPSSTRAIGELFQQIVEAAGRLLERVEKIKPNSKATSKKLPAYRITMLFGLGEEELGPYSQAQFQDFRFVHFKHLPHLQAYLKYMTKIVPVKFTSGRREVRLGIDLAATGEETLCGILAEIERPKLYVEIMVLVPEHSPEQRISKEYRKLYRHVEITSSRAHFLGFTLWQES